MHFEKQGRRINLMIVSKEITNFLEIFGKIKYE
jgi:hypothetical protein